MRTTFRKVGIACGTAFASAALALSTATGAGATSTAVVIGGIKVPTMSDLLMAPLLGGAFLGEERVSVSWPAEAGPYSGDDDMTLGASIAIGIPNLEAAISAALADLSRDAEGNVLNGEKVTVVGLSAGSLVVNEVLRNMVASGELVNPDEISFIVVEDSSRQELIKDTKYSTKFEYTYQPPPVTPYDVIAITGEYDGMADMPDRPWNLLAVANAMAGAIVVHVPVMYTTDLDELPNLPEKYITTEVNSSGGTTTHYLVPTKTLPLVQLLPFLKSKEAELKAKVDRGYKRNDPVTTTATATSLVAEVPAAEESAAPVTEAEPVAKTDAALRREARAEARAEAKEARAEAKAARAEARAEAKAEAAAKREARKAARAAADSDAPADETGSSDATGDSE